MIVIMQNSQEKADLRKMKINTIKTGKVHTHGNNFPTGKGGKSIVVVRLAGRQAGR